MAFIVAMAIAWQLAALSPRAHGAPERIAGARTTIAVLPFAASGADQEYLGDGVAEDIAAALARYHALAVIARSSSFHFGAGAEEAAHAGKALGARYVLAGSVRHDAANAHVTATLVDAASGARVWTKRIDGRKDDLLAARTAIVDGVAEALVYESDRAQAADGRRGAPASSEAYDRELLARQLIRRRGESDHPGAAVLAARRLLERAVTEQPDYAPVYSALSETYRAAFVEHMRHPALDGEFGSRDAIERAYRLAARAVALDAGSADAWAQLGWVLRWRLQLEDAIAAFERAHALNPNIVDARLGEPLVLAGRAVEAVPIIERAMRLDPLASPETIRSLGHAYYLLGDYGKAIDVLARCVQRVPEFASCHRLLAAAYFQAGRRDAAAGHVAAAMRAAPEWTIGTGALTMPYRRQEDLDRVVAGLRGAGFPQ